MGRISEECIREQAVDKERGRGEIIWSFVEKIVHILVIKVVGCILLIRFLSLNRKYMSLC